MENEDFSEEYYKMKYFKYRAKYEQLKEIAQQTGGMSNQVFMKQPLPPHLQQLPPHLLHQLPQKQSGSRVKDIPPQLLQLPPHLLQQPPHKQSVDQGHFQKNHPNEKNIKQLMKDIHDFVKKYVFPKNERKYKKIVGRLEEPCTYKQLEDIVNGIKIDLEEKSLKGFNTIKDVLEHAKKENENHTKQKKEIIDRIVKLCSNTTEGINALCKYVDEEDIEYKKNKPHAKQDGGYTDTPDSLDDVSEN